MVWLTEGRGEERVELRGPGPAVLVAKPEQLLRVARLERQIA